MKSFYIVRRDDTTESLEYVKKLSDYIESHGGKAFSGIIVGHDAEASYNMPKVDIVMVVGGDGTLIRTASSIYQLDVPIIGVNRGHMGYLCDLDDTNVFESIDEMLRGEYSIEERMMISGVVREKKKEEFIDISQKVNALNDIIVKSNEPFNIMRVVCYVNDTYLYAYDCDGIIFSTPTGSTAYNMSASGPIVNPNTNVILLTPINPHTLNAKSIVLDPMDVVSVSIERRNPMDEISAKISYDGNVMADLLEGQRFYVYKSSFSTKMIHLMDISFLDRIRLKMQNN